LIFILLSKDNEKKRNNQIITPKKTIMNVKNINFPTSQYYQEEKTKSQIVLHHTVSDPMSSIGDINYWMSDTARIATYVVINYDGTINKCFQSNQWAHHIGIKTETLKNMGFKDYLTRNLLLNKHSIGIEIDSWGGVTKKNGIFYNAYGKPLSNKLEVVEYDWRGYHYFQKYSNAQIDALAELLPILMKRHNIINYGIKDGNFDVRRDAISGKPGIYSHSSYRSDKSDIYPDDDLLKMINNL